MEPPHKRPRATVSRSKEEAESDPFAPVAAAATGPVLSPSELDVSWVFDDSSPDPKNNGISSPFQPQQQQQQARPPIHLSPSPFPVASVSLQQRTDRPVEAPRGLVGALAAWQRREGGKYARVVLSRVEENPAAAERVLFGLWLSTRVEVAIRLRDDWFYSTSAPALVGGTASGPSFAPVFSPGDIVHVVFTTNGPNEPNGTDGTDGTGPGTDSAGRAQSREFICDAAGHTWLIAHPDLLLNITNVGESSRCMRKSVLSQLSHVSGGPGSDYSFHAVLGDLLHDLFEQAVLGGVGRPSAGAFSTGAFGRPPLQRANSTERLIDSRFSAAALEASLRQLISQRVETLHASGETTEKAYNCALELIPNLVVWAEKFYMRHLPKEGCPRNNERNPSARVAVSKIHATEESIWSPMLGLKGKVDVCIQIRVQNMNHDSAGPAPIFTYVVPLELKSGKQLNDTGVSNEHLAQVMLYGVLMGDYYDAEGTLIVRCELFFPC
jgi:DNA replication factor Dna2